MPFLRGTHGAMLASSSTVSFVSGTNRRQMIIDALSPLLDEIRAGIAEKQIIIKPNMVYSGHPLCATHVDAVRGLLDILCELTDQTIIIGESNASGNVSACFSEYGYTSLTGEYNVELHDLNTSRTLIVDGFAGKEGGTVGIKILEPFLDSRHYWISICPPKTHNCAVATLTVKNMVMAAPLLTGINNQKELMHAGEYTPDTSPVLANNLFHLANRVLPSLAVVDGYEGMEGDGPIGEPSWGDIVNAVPHRIALAGTDAVAVDAVGFKLMGVQPEHPYYVMLCGNAGLGNYDLNTIVVNGPSLDSHVAAYRMHRNFSDQIAWIPQIDTSHWHGTPRGISPFLDVNNDGGYECRIRIDFALPFAGDARLSVCTLKARRIREIVSGRFNPGRYSSSWDGRDDHGAIVSRGHYLVVLQSESGHAARVTPWIRP